MGLCSIILRKFYRIPFVDSKTRAGLLVPFDKDGISYRMFGEGDSIRELTDLINKAYSIYGEQGLSFLAVDQDISGTLKRLKNSYTFLALEGRRMVGCISYKPKWECRGTPWFNRNEVSKFNQLAVDPDTQSHGIGGRLLQIVEDVALKLGSKELALDTSEEAVALLAYYKKRSYHFIEYKQWSFTNYRSVILSKKLK